MPSRKTSRNGFDYAASQQQTPGSYADPRYRGGGAGGYATVGYGGYSAYPYTQPYYPGYPTHPAYGGAYVQSGYASNYGNAYGAEGYNNYMRNQDPTYDAFYAEGPSVDDKWRSTYPYVPTSYSQQTQDRQSNSGGTIQQIGRDGDTSNPNTNSETANKDPEDGERESWGSQWEFIFSCVGLSVGIGNVWRFPYLAYENGGGAFLIPYVILLVLVGKPMYFMEVALGQFSQLGPLAVWKLSPIGRGIGFAMCTLSLIVAIYYNVIMGYCLHYIFASFAKTLPWESCTDDRWVSGAGCFDSLVKSTTTTTTPAPTVDSITTADDAIPITIGQVCKPINISNVRQGSSSAEQYWERFVLGIHTAKLGDLNIDINGTATPAKHAFATFGDIGEIKWDLALCLLLSWIIVFACLAKGIKSSGKVVYFTATFPYLILIILMIRGLLLDGAIDGIRFFFVPKWEKLLDIVVWRKAAEQMFFSLSVSWGGLIMFGSYNKFNTRVHIHATLISSLDFVTSLIAGVVVFSILGNLSCKLGVPIENVVQQKQGLAFVVYPEAILNLYLPQLWSVLFFFMLFLLGLDSQFAFLETVLTGIYDWGPAKLKNYKPIVVAIFCSFCYLLSIPCVSVSGQYVFDLMDTYGGGLGVLWVAIFESTVIMWVYGVTRFADDLGFMLNHKISIFWKVCWSITPVILSAILVIAMVHWVPPTYEGSQETIHYPEWAHHIGWFLTLFIVLQIPIVAIFMVIYYGCKGKIREVTKPTSDWGPGDKSAKNEWIRYKQAKAMEAMTCKAHPQAAAYDNYAMNYPVGYYTAPGPSYHM